MAFTWATDPGAVVTAPSGARQLVGYVDGNKPPAGEFNWLFQQVANVSQRQAMTFQGVGSVQAMIDYYLDAIVCLTDTEITGIQITCRATPASGTVEVELFKATPGGSPTTLYTSSPLPTLTCNGGYASAASANLPDVTTVSASDLILAKVTNAPAGTYDVTVHVL